MVRKYNRHYIDTNFGEGFMGYHENELLFNCELNSIRNLTLKDCVLNRSKFLVEDLEKTRNFTVTLNCRSFDNVELSPLLLDLFLLLLTKTKGNDSKRLKILKIVGHERAKEILNKMETMDN